MGSGGLLLVVASKGRVCHSCSHCVLAHAIAVSRIVAGGTWLYWFPWRQYLIPSSVQKLRLQHGTILSTMLVITSTTMRLVTSCCIAASCVRTLTHLIIRSTLQSALQLLLSTLHIDIEIWLLVNLYFEILHLLDIPQL